jgi:hypothetical protein
MYPDYPSPAFHLSGMEFASFKHSPDYWTALTGVDPRHYPQWFTVRSGTVGCNPEYRAMVANYFRQTQGNFAMLTERSC